jgi:hypothetical protein
VTQISGDKMRVESKQQIQIIDLEAEQIIKLDTKKKTYSVMTFEEMKAQMKAAMGKAQQSTEKAKSEGTADVSAETNIKVTATDNQEEVGGYSCKQFLMEMDVAIEDQKSGQEGEFSTLTELWLTKEAPGAEEMVAFHRKMAEKLGSAQFGMGFAASGDDHSNPMGANMQQMVSEMRKLDGFTMRSVFYFGSPEAARKEALKTSDSGEKEEKEEGGGGFGGFLKNMPVPGGGGGGVVMKMTNEVNKIHTNPIDPSHFSIPEKYKQTEAK